MEENTVNAVETTEKTAKADKVEKKAAKKDKKPGFFHGLKKEYKKIAIQPAR